MLKFFGIIKMLELIFHILWFARRHMRTTDHLTARYGKGSWALITGGSDGLGLEMA
jgi:NADP-dependent 3-hydroxy acid dehydrogenase YdfG